jgi:hypothetical protein
MRLKRAVSSCAPLFQQHLAGRRTRAGVQPKTTVVKRTHIKVGNVPCISNYLDFHSKRHVTQTPSLHEIDQTVVALVRENMDDTLQESYDMFQILDMPPNSQPITDQVGFYFFPPRPVPCPQPFIHLFHSPSTSF